MNEFDSRAWNWDADGAKLDRARRVAAAIAAQAGPLAGLDGLDYGCGTGLLGFELQPHLGQVTMADTSQGMLAVLRQKIEASGAANVTPLELDLASDPVPPGLLGRFDLVCTLMTLHHIPDTDGILSQFHALLAPGGRLCISDLDTEDGSFHGTEVEVHRGFDRADLAARLARAGFDSLRFCTPFEVVRSAEDGEVRYPAFLVVARRA